MLASRPHVFFLFATGDCPTSLEEIDALNTLAKRGDYVVEGIVVEDRGVAEREVRAVMKSYRVEFPFTIRPPDAVAPFVRRLGYDSVPLTIITDARQRVQFATPEAMRIGDFDALPASAGAKAPANIPR